MASSRAEAAPPTRAMILAAGLGTRLRPLTDRVPKCMIPLAGRPLLAHTVEWLRAYGVTELVINVHHLAEVVERYFGDGARFGVRIVYSVEEELLGTAGAVKVGAREFDRPFFVWYGDNLSACRIDHLWGRHREHPDAAATIALFHREDPTQSGIVGLDPHGRITRFLEKPLPAEVFSRWISAGIFVLEPRVLDAIPPGRFSDFGRDIFPALLAHGEPLYGYQMSQDEGLWWIDRPEDLARLERTWHGLPDPPGGGATGAGAP